MLTAEGHLMLKRWNCLGMEQIQLKLDQTETLQSLKNETPNLPGGEC